MSDAPFPPPPPPPAGGSWSGPPGGGVPGGAQLASWGQRVGAYLLNMAFLMVAFIIVAIIAGILSAIVEFVGVLFGIFGYLGVTFASFYFYWLDGEVGASPGKRVLGLRTVKADTGQVIGGGMGIVRAIAHVAGQIICGIGFLFPLWDEKRQTLADKIVGTVVLSGQPKSELGPAIFKK